MTAEPRKPAARRVAAPTGSDRSDADRQADHAAIDRLADELVPALIAKLSASGLGEIEVGEGDWTIRVRRPADASRRDRRATDRPSRAQPGHAGHGHAPGGFEGHRSARDARDAREARAVSTGSVSSNGSSPGAMSQAGSAAGEDRDTASIAELMDAHRAVATSPAVGIFQPRAEAKTGTRVRAGDRLGAVDMLGIPQEVVAPADGIVGASLVEPGQAVEYGQELIVIELAGGRTGERVAGAGGASAATGSEG